VQLHFTPTSASWINLVERWFATLTEKQIRRGVHRSTRELEAAIRHYIDLTNAAPKPFVWAKTADEILARVARFCHRMSNSGHRPRGTARWPRTGFAASRARAWTASWPSASTRPTAPASAP
jgi:hypothetical protein